MQAIEVARFGGPEVLTPVPAAEPVAGPGQVVVDVAFADVLWVETMIRRGLGGPAFPVQPPYRPGFGVAGTVASVGDGVDTGWIHRRVLARTRQHGGYVERALVSAEGLVTVRDAVPTRRRCCTTGSPRSASQTWWRSSPANVS